MEEHIEAALTKAADQIAKLQHRVSQLQKENAELRERLRNDEVKK